MRLSLPCAAAAMIGSSLLAGGCATLPASPVPAPLSDRQAIVLADEYLDQRGIDEPRFVSYVEPTGYGNLVSVRGSFDPDAKPPVPSRLIMVKHDGDVREIRFP